jgi:hypothetical protein
VWVWGEMNARGDFSAARRFVGPVHDLVEVLFPALRGRSLHPRVWNEARARRFSFRSLADMGVYQRADDGGRARWHYTGEVAWSAVASSDAATRAQFLQLCGELHGPAQHGLGRYSALLTSFVETMREIVVETVASRGIVLEYCPTSNATVAGYDSYGDHPFHQAADPRIGATINTDNPSLFQVRLSDEFGAMAGDSRESKGRVENARQLGLASFGGGRSRGESIRRELGTIMSSLSPIAR